MNKARALRCDIFKNKGCDASNGGLSSKYDEILLICPDGNVEIDLDSPPENLCEYVLDCYGRRTNEFIRPYAPVPKGHVGYMFGGTLVYTSDSRFGHNALRLHDRSETVEQYDMLSM